ncbi:hypothetical protein Scel_04630 [Streptomyces cellostaticus]|nr:hypothetical protein Scel_04630 [Streptomyces cellostaticus]
MPQPTPQYEQTVRTFVPSFREPGAATGASLAVLGPISLRLTVRTARYTGVSAPDHQGLSAPHRAWQAGVSKRARLRAGSQVPPASAHASTTKFRP